MIYEVTVGDDRVRVDIAANGRFLIDDAVVAAEIAEIVRGRQWSVRIAGRSHEVTVLTHDPLRLLVDGGETVAGAVDERAAAAARGAGALRGGRHEIRAPMPGLLKTVHVAEGDVVERDAPLMTLEAMKMENELLAPARARVVRLAVGAGMKVEGGAMLAVLEEAE
ncbi:MAG TPA: biotin/lipoyl-containing protein [Candidatus Limnocylindria bacterium]|nr:biotin/lipoyl-containing protein [Candidatus Limnocylindria bacterium]